MDAEQFQVKIRELLKVMENTIQGLDVAQTATLEDYRTRLKNAYHFMDLACTMLERDGQDQFAAYMKGMTK